MSVKNSLHVNIKYQRKRHYQEAFFRARLLGAALSLASPLFSCYALNVKFYIKLRKSRGCKTKRPSHFPFKASNLLS